MSLTEAFSTPAGAVAQSLGFVAMLLAFFIFAFRDRRKILISKLIADALWAVHYLLLGAYSGAAVNTVNMFREGIFYQKGKRKWANNCFIPIFFICANLLFTIFSWQGPVSLLPMLGASCLCICLWSSNTTHLRFLALPGQILWLVYAILVASVPSIIFDAISILSLLYALVRDLRGDRRTKKETPEGRP